jgi:hypothetical protein
MSLGKASKFPPCRQVHVRTLIGKSEPVRYKTIGILNVI